MPLRHASSDSTTRQTSSSPLDENKSNQNPAGNDKPENSKIRKTVEEQDAELRMKLEGISGGGGEAGLELEDGKPVAMKRSVKENMCRLI